MNNFTVNFKLKAIIGVEVHAENFENAISIAREKLNKKGIFQPHIEYVDGNYTDVAGVNNNDNWDVD